MYNYRSHTETECLINRFVELYLDLSMSDDVHVDSLVIYKPQMLAFKVILNCECDGISVHAVYEALNESADAKEITVVVENLITMLKEEYGKVVSKKLLRRRD